MSRTIHGDIPRRVSDDGKVWFSGADAAELLLRGFDINSLNIEISPEVETYNAWCDRQDKTDYSIVEHGEPLSNRIETWWLDDFADLPVRDEILSRCINDAERERTHEEMDLYEARGLIPVLRMMFKLVDHFRRRNVVWGVGRGSSVNSFVLYKIGVHKINPMHYGLVISDFLKD